MSALEDLGRATARLQELADRIRDAAGHPQPEIEELARQASDVSAAVADLIPRAIAEAEAAARSEDGAASGGSGAHGATASATRAEGPGPGASGQSGAIS